MCSHRNPGNLGTLSYLEKTGVFAGVIKDLKRRRLAWINQQALKCNHTPLQKRKARDIQKRRHGEQEEAM